MFLFFGIAYIEVFGLARWNSGETHYQNYRNFENALVMLAFMSTGYESHSIDICAITDLRSAESHGTNTCMISRCILNLNMCWRLKHGYSGVEYPFCTNPTKDVPYSDCGSTPWAFALFIVWNVLSMVRALCIISPNDASAEISRAVYLPQHVYW